MINVSAQFKEDVVNDNRRYIPVITITLADGTVLSIDPDDIWQSGLTIRESMADGETLEIGSVNISKCVLSLNNVEEKFTEYDFAGAVVNVQISLALTTGETETFQKGVYTVDTANYDNSLVTLTCLDNLSKFDRSIKESSLSYPATLSEIVSDACTVCGVSFATSTFLNQNLSIPTKPEREITFRTLLGYVAQIACSNVRTTPTGEIEFVWYDINAMLTYEQGTRISEDGDTRIAENGADTRTGEITADDLRSYTGLDFIDIIYSLNASLDDIFVTGVRTVVYDADNITPVSYLYGADDYVLLIENNDLVTTRNYESIAASVGAVLVGTRYRKARLSHCGMPFIQVGDVAAITDSKGNDRRILISNTSFTVNDKQSSTSTGQNPARNKADVYSAALQAAIITGQAINNFDTKLNQQKVYNKLMGDEEVQTPVLRTASLKAAGMRAAAAEDRALILEDGKIYINADYITAGVIDADLIKAGAISDESGENTWNLETGDLSLNGTFSTNIDDDGYGITIDDGEIQFYRQGALVGKIKGTESTDNVKAFLMTCEDDSEYVGFALVNSSGKYVPKFVYKKTEDLLACFATGLTMQDHPIYNINADSTIYGAGYLVYMMNTNNHIQIGYANNYIWFYLNGTSKYYLNQSYSDKRQKKYIKKINQDILDKVLKVEIKQFVMKDDETNRPRFGIIAQEVQEALGEENNEVIVHAPEEDSDTLFVDNEQFLYARIAADERRIKDLEARIEKLEQLLQER